MKLFEGTSCFPEGQGDTSMGTSGTRLTVSDKKAKTGPFPKVLDVLVQASTIS